MEDDAIETLIDNGLMNMNACRQACFDWRGRKREMMKDVETKKGEIKAEMNTNSVNEDTAMGKELMAYLVGRVIDKYP